MTIGSRVSNAVARLAAKPQELWRVSRLNSASIADDVKLQRINLMSLEQFSAVADQIDMGFFLRSRGKIHSDKLARIIDLDLHAYSCDQRISLLEELGGRKERSSISTLTGALNYKAGPGKQLTNWMEVIRYREAAARVLGWFPREAKVLTALTGAFGLGVGGHEHVISIQAMCSVANIGGPEAIAALKERLSERSSYKCVPDCIAVFGMMGATEELAKMLMDQGYSDCSPGIVAALVKAGAYEKLFELSCASDAVHRLTIKALLGRPQTAFTAATILRIKLVAYFRTVDICRKSDNPYREALIWLTEHPYPEIWRHIPLGDLQFILTDERVVPIEEREKLADLFLVADGRAMLKPQYYPPGSVVPKFQTIWFRGREIVGAHQRPVA